MDPLSMIASTASSLLTGGPAPSSASSDTAPNYINMNSPFSVAGQGGTATAHQGLSPAGGAINQTYIWLALLIGGAFLLFKK